MNLVIQFFIVTVAVVAPMKPTTCLEAFTTIGAPDLPFCEKISNTIILLLTLKTNTQ
jgi:hypothetical protein